MSTLAKRVERLEAKMAPPVARKVALAFCQKTEDGRNRMTCDGLEVEQEPDETQESFEVRMRLHVGADMLIFVKGLERKSLMPFVTTAGRVVLVPKKAPTPA